MAHASSGAWFKFFPTEWMTSRAVRQMSPTQRGYYIQLIVEWWNGRGVLPVDNIKDVAWLAGAASVAEFKQNGGEFVIEQLRPGGSGHKMLADLWQEWLSKSTKSRAAAEKRHGVSTAAALPSQDDHHADADQTGCVGNADAMRPQNDGTATADQTGCVGTAYALRTECHARSREGEGEVEVEKIKSLVAGPADAATDEVSGGSAAQGDPASDPTSPTESSTGIDITGSHGAQREAATEDSLPPSSETAAGDSILTSPTAKPGRHARQHAAHSEIERAHLARHGVKVPWGPAEGKLLKAAVATVPSDFDWPRAVANFYASATVTASVRGFLAEPAKYLEAPLDRFKNPVDQRWKRQIASEQGATEIEQKRKAKVEQLQASIPDALRNCWRDALAIVEKTVNLHSFDTWLKPVRLLAIKGGDTAVLLVPNEEFQHINAQFGTVLLDALDRATDGKILGFEVKALSEVAA